MSHLWLLMTFTWFGTVRLQYINSGGPDGGTSSDTLDPAHRYTMPDVNFYNNIPSQSDIEDIESYNQFYQTHAIKQAQNLQRKRRTIREAYGSIPEQQHWSTNVDADHALYALDRKLSAKPLDVVQNFPEYAAGSNITNEHYGLMDARNKKSFSPWGGKRSRYPKAEHVWTWTRSSSKREPSMPKRVRFSPWGGKRSGHLIYKSGTKGPKIIFSSYEPELSSPLVAKYADIKNKYNLAGFNAIPSIDKRQPIRFLALSTKLANRNIRDAFNSYLEPTIKMFKPGHSFLDVNMKKDGKRKVKFSAWGGKRSPPIIGPIWTPAHNGKDSILDAILLIRNSQDVNDISSNSRRSITI